MDETIIAQICLACFSQQTGGITRCTTGQGNYVYLLETGGEKYIVRCSREEGAYTQTVYWLEKLAAAGISVPRVIRQGTLRGYAYLVLSYLEGDDLGAVYPALTAEDKRAIAKEVVEIQRRAGTLDPGPLDGGWTWRAFVDEMLARARERIIRNGFFDAEKADRLSEAAGELDEYFARVRPVVYLDDISTKNLLIHNRRVSGVVDIDWVGTGDWLTYAALTNMALLNLRYDTDYVQYLLEEMRVSGIEQRAFLFYTLLFCVDFMGERGAAFLDKTVAVNGEIIAHLNNLYDRLWKTWAEGPSGAAVQAGSSAPFSTNRGILLS